MFNSKKNFCYLIGENCFWCEKECNNPEIKTPCDYCFGQTAHWDKYHKSCWEFLKQENEKEWWKPKLTWKIWNIKQNKKMKRTKQLISEFYL